MASSNMNNGGPPKLDRDGKGFNAWKKDTRLWCQITKVAEKNKATMIYLQGIPEGTKARSIAHKIPEDKLQSNEGVKILLEALDKELLPEKPMRLFNANKMFKNTKRHANTRVHDFIIEFETARYVAELEGITFDDTLLGLNLLDQCQLPEDKQQLVISGLTEINYENVKCKLQSIFFNEQEQSNNKEYSENPTLFSDYPEVLYSNNYRGRGGGVRGPRNRGRGRFAGGAKHFGRSERQQHYRKMNPSDKDGKITRCNICESRFHWARNCQHAHENQKSQKENGNTSRQRDDGELFSLLVTNRTENVTMFAGNNIKNNIEKMKALREETRGSAIVDCGCVINVCGEKWMEDYMEALTPDQKEKIREEPSDQYFSFGLGGTAKAKCKMTVPCWLNGKRGSLSTHMVEDDMPLLLSKHSLVKMGLIVDFGNALMTSSTGNTVVELWETSSGHFALPLSL